MRGGGRSTYQLAKVLELRKRVEDPEARVELVRLCRQGMLVPYWEKSNGRKAA